MAVLTISHSVSVYSNAGDGFHIYLMPEWISSKDLIVHPYAMD